MKKVSIIVPVYNVEKYIDKCLNSLVNQTLDNYEIIIVVDGSKDRSIDIVKKYKEQYPEIITFYETENHGLSAARNYGLEKANGEYVGFVDSDDYVDVTMFEKMYDCAVSNDYDIVVSDYYKITEKEHEEKILDIKETDSREDIVLKAKPYAWNKIYRKSIFEKFNIKFPEGLIFEDICTIYPLMIEANKIGYVNNFSYYYIYNRSDSIMKSKKIDSICILKTLSMLNNYCIDKGIFEKHKKLLCEINVRHIYYRINDMKNKKNSTLYDIKFIYKSFKLLNKKFPQWRKESEYAQKLNNKRKSMILLQLVTIKRGVKRWKKK